MNEAIDKMNINRREFLKRSGSLAAGAAVLGSIAPVAYAGEDNTIRLALIGCGGRGSGAVGDGLSVPDSGPVELYAMADLDRKRMDSSQRAIQKKFGERANVSEECKFIGFDAYRRAIDILKPGDVAMCTTRAYIRPVHVEYAIKKGINVFMEKPFASDPGGLHRMLKLYEIAEKKNIKVAAGLQCRHSPARQALIKKIRDGEMGEIPLIRANRMGGRRWLSDQGEKSNDLVSQLGFGKIHLLYVGSGHMVDNLIHQIDECCWIKNGWPVSAVGFGGREPRSQDHGQNVDTYAMEFTYKDGTKAFCGFRRMNKARSEFATFIHGTKCAAQFSGRTHAATVHMFKDQRIEQDNISWTPTKDAHRPWQYEWNEFIKSIREDRRHNEIKRAVYSDFASLMGRAACHTGQMVTWEQMMKSDFQFCDYLDELDYDSPPPVKADKDGWFPVPIGGQWKEV
ncbi:MAG: twin-arginine translocation signal domain-containing protein [Phycisphaerae bacterium]|nr:twin-arginine translocation signal domain-containing protein [Phycisphaerae bacterium]